MKNADVLGAQQFAFNLLKTQLSPDLTYHSLAHTYDDVLPAALRLADLVGVTATERDLVAVAAAFHDVGFTELRMGHEAVSVEIVQETLPTYGFTPAAVEHICHIIMATCIPQTPMDVLGQILADSDLDILGRREDFWLKNDALRAEMAAYGELFSDEAWYRTQLQFVRKHKYFTAAAKQLRQAGKAQNLIALEARLHKTLENII